MIISKKVVGLVAVLALAAAAFIVFMPAVSSAQVPVDANDILCYTEEEANQMLMDGFELNFPVCDEDEDEGGGGNPPPPPPPPEDEGGDDTIPPADNNNSSSSSSGGGGGKPRIAGSGGEVLGTTTVACDTPLLTTYLGVGKANDLVETVKLQLFLSTELGLENLVTGAFDPATHAAVEQFQLKYAEEVLAPWVPFGLASAETPTGYVYKTTQRMINNIHCEALEIPMPQLP